MQMLFILQKLKKKKKNAPHPPLNTLPNAPPAYPKSEISLPGAYHVFEDL